MVTLSIKINLTDNQISKLRAAHNKKRAVTIRLKHEQLTLLGKHTINLTPLQYKKLVSAKNSKAKRGVQLTFTHTQIGGFWGTLLSTLASAVAPTVVKGISNLINKKPFFEGDGLQKPKKKKKTHAKRGKGLFLAGTRENYRR
jgi:hypothetical protein